MDVWFRRGYTWTTIGLGLLGAGWFGYQAVAAIHWYGHLIGLVITLLPLTIAVVNLRARRRPLLHLDDDGMALCFPVGPAHRVPWEAVESLDLRPASLRIAVRRDKPGAKRPRRYQLNAIMVDQPLPDIAAAIEAHRPVPA